MTTPVPAYTLVAIGEALFDHIGPTALLGGAPLNVAVHAQALAKPHAGRAVLVSRIGQDALGERLTRELQQRGLTTEYLQTDPDHRTGRVDIQRKPDGGHTFHIADNAAYDWMQYDPDLDTLAQAADAVTFGTLAQRNAQSRFTLRRFLEQAEHALRLFDVNLRSNGPAKPFYNRDLLQHGCEHAHLVKLNEEELPLVADLLRLTPKHNEPVQDTTARLRDAYQLQAVILTQGKQGTAAQTQHGFQQALPELLPETTPPHADPKPGEGSGSASQPDTIGAGDACTAALLTARLLNHDWPAALAFANRIASFVAHQPGATPTLPDALIASLQ